MFAAASWREFAYFRILKLPETSTIYDFMLLTLRLKDLIATFNWDPFLFRAFVRNHRNVASLPQLSFLHGSVAVGYSQNDRRAGQVGMRSKATGQEFEPTRLLCSAGTIRALPPRHPSQVLCARPGCFGGRGNFHAQPGSRRKVGSSGAHVSGCFVRAYRSIGSQMAARPKTS